MKLIIGLGNPGAKYQRTRHNVGALLVQYMVQENRIVLKKQRGLSASFVSTTLENEEVIFAQPDSYMNVSGKAVLSLVNYFGVNPATELLVAIDDYALPFGKLRLRAHGSEGGHNGLKSVSASLSSKDYARLRIGIGEPQGVEQVVPLESYVLSKFLPEEWKQIESVLKDAQKACLLWITQPIERAMNVVNP